MIKNTQHTCSYSHSKCTFILFIVTFLFVNPNFSMQKHTMASLYCQTPIVITSLVLSLLIALSPPTLSQGLPMITPVPTISDCTSSLLPLTPCAPFVQGMAKTPVQSCCDNLNQLYLQQPGCLCLLLNNTNLGSFPINSTLALELPALCNIQVNNSTCSGIIPEVPSGSPASQVSLGAHNNSSAGTHTNSSIAASPMIQVAPRSTIMGLGLGQNTGARLKSKGPLALLVTLAAIL